MIDQDAGDCMNGIVAIEILIDQPAKHCLDWRFLTQSDLIFNDDMQQGMGVFIRQFYVSHLMVFHHNADALTIVEFFPPLAVRFEHWVVSLHPIKPAM